MSLIAICLGFFMVVVDAMIVTVALPSMATGLGASLTDLQWVVDAYTLTFTSLLLLSGSLADNLGARRAFIGGLILFILTSLGCGLAPTATVLIVFRLLQGIGGAMVLPTSIALIHASYDDPTKRTHAIGIWAMLGGLGAAAGPVLGGVVTSFLGWRAIFFINIPVGLIAIYLTYRTVINPPKIRGKRHDIGGQSLAILMFSALAYALIEWGHQGLGSHLVQGAIFLFVGAVFMFIWVERSVREPVFPLSFCQIPAFRILMLFGFLLNVPFFGLLFLLPLYFQNIRGDTVLATGLALMPLMLFNPLTNFICGRLTAKVGSKAPMIGGTLVAGLGYLLFACVLWFQPGQVNYFTLILPLIFIGAGASFTIPAATIAILDILPSDKVGIASGLFNTARQLGSLVGVALCGTLVVIMPRFMLGFEVSFVLGFVLYLFLLIALYRLKLRGGHTQNTSFCD